MKPAGYLIATKDGVVGESGMFYDYILGSNGLFLSAKNRHFEATVCIAPTEVRGLALVERRVRLIHGKIPMRFYDLALSTFLIKPIKERFFAVTWGEGAYQLRYPEQDGNPGGVRYDVLKNVVMDMHSHGNMPAFFSGTDDCDEQGFKLSLVVGRVETEPEYLLRISVYGYFDELNFEEVFDGCITLITTQSEETEGTHGPSTSSGAAARVATSQKGLPGFFPEKPALF